MPERRRHPLVVSVGDALRWPLLIPRVAPMIEVTRDERARCWRLDCEVCGASWSLPYRMAWQERANWSLLLLAHALDHSARGDLV